MIEVSFFSTKYAKQVPQRCLLNPSRLARIYEDPTWPGCVGIASDGVTLWIKQTYDEVRELVQRDAYYERMEYIASLRAGRA